MTTNGQRSELSDSTTLASFSARVAKGASALVGMRMIVRVLGFISMLILARLLTPEDYGIIALATLLHGLLIAMSDFGFGLAIIRDSEAKDVDYHTAWTLRVLRSAVVALIVIVSAVPFADFYEDSRLQSVMYCYAAMAMVMGLENIGTVNFIKEMRYRDDFNYFFISKLVSFIVGITAAFILRNYWALVIGSFCLSLSRLGLSYYLDSFRPRF